MTTVSANNPAQRQARFRQKVAKTARWLHIYLSMVSFAIVLFFSATGLTLNHPTWFASSVKTRQISATVDEVQLHRFGSTEAGKADLIQAVRKAQHLHGAVDEVRADDAEISFSYKAPGYSADVTINRQSGSYSVTEVRNGFIAVMNDLHKGRDSGKGWGVLIDLSAILLTLVSFTGLVILWFVYKRRTSGLVLGAVGFFLCLLAYSIFVP